MDGTKLYYNQSALEWLNRRKDDDSVMPMFKTLLSYLPQNPNILDLCCGVGYDSERLNQLGASVIGLDFSEESIKIAEREYPNSQFYVGNMLEDYSHIGRFDGCILLAGLVHLPTDKLSVAFCQLNKVLNEEAYLLIVVKDGVGKNLRMSMKTIDDVEIDRQFFDHTLDELKKASKKNFTFVMEHIDDPTSMWKNYIFKKRGFNG